MRAFTNRGRGVTKKRVRWVIEMALLGLSLSIVTSHAQPSPEQPLVIAVAANFAEPAEQLVASFTEKTGVPVRLVMGSTGLLYAQITQGASIDLFLAADTDRPRALIAQNLAKEQSFAIYARGRLVFWVPGITGPPDPVEFMTAFESVALANPLLAPFGRAASEVLARFPEESERLRFVRGQNISATYTQIASGAVPGGFVALGQVLAQGVPPVEYTIIPKEWHEPIEQAVVLIKGENRHPAGQEFRHFLLSKNVSVMLNSLGYLAVGG